MLAQGAGRLIRRRTDRGVVAVFDSRLATRRYKTQLLAAMPPFRRSVDLEQTCAFLGRGGHRGFRGSPGAGGGAGTEGIRAHRRARRPVDAGHGLDQGHHPCPICDAAPGERCRTDEGTLAFLHSARVSNAIY